MRLLCMLSVATVVATVGLVGSASSASTTVLPANFQGVYSPKAGETVTAAGPLRYVTIRISQPGVTVRNVQIMNAANGRSRPGMIEVYASDATLDGVTLRGSNTEPQQNQGVYADRNATGLRALNVTCDNPGMDQFYDHCFYLNGTRDFLIDRLTCQAESGACIHLYSGGATGVVRNSDLGRAAWNVVAWGSGNDVRVESSRLHHAIKVSGGRGYAVEAASGGRVTLTGSLVCGAATAGNVSGKHGVMQNGGSFADAAGNTYAKTCSF
jgi:hypothetical protein